MSSRKIPRDLRKNQEKNRCHKKAAAQAEGEHAEAQAKSENAAAEAKSENTEAEADEVEGTRTGTMMNDGVRATGEAGGRHVGSNTVNEEAGHIVFHTEHVEHDMNDDTGERTKAIYNTTNANGEQTEIVIENENAEAEAEGVEGTSAETMLKDAVEAAGETGEEHSELSTVNDESGHIVGEEHHARCALSDEEAGSTVLHVSSDMNEKDKDDEEAGETAAAKETEEISKEDVEIRRLIEERRNTPKEEEQRLKEVSKCKKKCIRDKKE